jgi:hypothetical protein
MFNNRLWLTADRAENERGLAWITGRRARLSIMRAYERSCRRTTDAPMPIGMKATMCSGKMRAAMTHLSLQSDVSIVVAGTQVKGPT